MKFLPQKNCFVTDETIPHACNNKIFGFIVSWYYSCIVRTRYQLLLVNLDHWQHTSIPSYLNGLKRPKCALFIQQCCFIENKKRFVCPRIFQRLEMAMKVYQASIFEPFSCIMVVFCGYSRILNHDGDFEDYSWGRAQWKPSNVASWTLGFFPFGIEDRFA